MNDNKWKIITGMSIFTLVFSLLTLLVVSSRTSSNISAMEEILNAHINKVILMAPDGKVMEVDKVPMKPSMYKQYIRYVVAEKLLIDKYRLTEGFNIIANNIDVLYNQSNFVRKLFDFFPTKDESPQSYNKLVAYLEFLLSQLNADDLPEFIHVVDVINDDIIENNNEFVYKGKYNVKVISLDIVTKNIRETLVDVDVAIKGKFEPLEGTFDNPYGLKIEDFRLPKFSKKQ